MFVTFYLACLLTFYLAYLLTLFLAIYLAYLYAFFLADKARRCPVRSGAPGRSPADEVRQCSVRSGAPGNSPAVPSASWSSQKKSGSAGCDLELSDAVRQCSVRSVLFPFQVLSSSLKSCLSFEVSSVRFKASLLFRILSFVGSPLFVSRRLFCFEFSLSLEVLSFVGSPLFVSIPLCH